MVLVLRATALLAAAALAACGSAAASQLIDRKASNVRLSVSAAGIATVSYRAHGLQKHVLAWGARDALAPTQARPQVRFHLDYSGGWGSFGKALWQAPNACRPYRGPKLAWLVAACTAPDGSYWAVQRWRRLIPMGASEGTWELHLSHWTGSPASLRIHVEARQGADLLFGRFTYRGAPYTGSAPPLRAHRSTRTVATSTWTRRALPTARAGIAKTASSPIGRPGCSATRSALRTAGERSIARPPSARA